MVRVKICGITNWADAQICIDAGADSLGFNFYAKSPRYISPDDARAIIRRLPRHVLPVGVFVNAPLAGVLRIARRADLSMLQLHGDEPPAILRKLSEHFPVMKAFRMRPGFKLHQLARFSVANAFLLDGFDSELRGGTGHTFHWRKAREAKKYGPIVIAGGLTPENIARAIVEADPFGADVCSGVEVRPGKKDPRRVLSLMKAVSRTRKHTT